MAHPRAFFDTKALVAHQGQKHSEAYSFINTGSEQFDAVAVALIDSLQSSLRDNDSALKKILDSLRLSFPDSVSTKAYLTSQERMKMLLSSSRRSELVASMAYVLRQLAVDEMCANPLKYREAFQGLAPETPERYLRDPNTQLPACAVDALAHSLGITITLSYKEPDKELRRRVIYHGDEQSTATKTDLVIQVQGDHYFPGVKHKNDFAYVGQLAINAPKPVDNKSGQDRTLADVIDVIDKDDKQLLQSYHQWRNTILSMVAAEELTLEQLVALYITFLPTQPNNSFSLPALEKSESKPTIAGVPYGVKQRTIELLASSLASWISTNLIEADQLFDQLENHPVSSLAALK